MIQKFKVNERSFSLGAPCASLPKRVRFDLGFAGCVRSVIDADRSFREIAPMLNLYVPFIRVTVTGDMCLSIPECHVS